MFENIHFIKAQPVFDKKASTAPMFRKTFNITEEVKSAVLSVAALGYGYYRINGKKVTEDLFTAPVSDYRKTVWYNTYDVAPLLHPGKNVIFVMCGNGWYNENMASAWDYDKAPWRDSPKVILSLEINGELAVKSDESFKVSLDGPVTYNELRSGEHFDSRLYDGNVFTVDYDDSAWPNAVTDENEPAGVFRKCEAEPIRECEYLAAKKMIKVSDNKVIYDFGRNISGYVRLRVKEKPGDKIIIRHVEEINDDLSLEYNEMNGRYYPETPFQECEFTACGKEFTYSPLFTYHGFRFAEVTGLENADINDAVAVFVHQDIKRRSHFECSDDFLNSLFEAGIASSYSNMFYMPTDCPTREKLGWMNDAQASTEQFLTDFEAEKFLTKWEQDIFDAMNEKGALPGIVPSSGWGFGGGSGPDSDGSLFEIPYRIYLNTGDDSLLKKVYPAFLKYFSFLKTLTDENGDITFGLNDHAGPVFEKQLGATFINKMLIIKFLRIRRLAEERLGIDTEETEKEIEKEIADAKKKYLLPDGRCTIDEQTSVGMMIYFGIYDDLSPLKRQIAEITERQNFHHFCGMVGLRYLYIALNKCGLYNYAYKIITSDGEPSYREWMKDGATALYERWSKLESKNHHMFSDVMSWMMKTIIGINIKEGSVAYKETEIAPVFFDELTHAKGHIDTVNGRISVSWRRMYDKIELKIEIPEGIKATYRGTALKSGLNEIEV